MHSVKQTETTETTNGESALTRIRKQYSGKDPDKQTAAKLVAAWKAADKQVVAAELALAKLKTAESDAVTALAVAYGGKSLRIDGQVMDFACRGATVFFRRKSADVVDVG